jgi:quercetin dioxygenase-like cupin family protein
MSTIRSAQLVVPTRDFPADLAFFNETLGFSHDTIFPADDPAVATLSGHGLCIRLDRNAGVAPVTLRLLCDEPAAFSDGRLDLISPGGTQILVVPSGTPLVRPPTEHAFVVRRLKDNAPWVIGRAGMAYRDLIPGRLGGSIIASHIRIKDAGPVPDMVHYHTVGFQLIFCYRGWVRLVYEDQGPPFVLGAGDCVIQPPQIRHRVLEASEGVEVVEIGVPAEHVTTVDHDMELPNGVLNPDRDFSGQRFCRSLTAEAVWAPGRLPGFEARDTGIGEATKGVASVLVFRPASQSGDGVVTRHSSDILFTFVLEGSVTLDGDGQGAHPLSEGDAYVIPPGLETSLTDASADLRLLEVSLPALT